MERLLLPRLNSIDGDIKEMNARVDGGFKEINVKIDALKAVLRSEKVVDTRVEALDKKLDTDRRMAILEAKVKELEKRR